MKKILCGTLLALASSITLAADPKVEPTFEKVQELIKAKDFNTAYKDMVAIRWKRFERGV